MGITHAKWWTTILQIISDLQELPRTLFSWVENEGNGDETSTNVVQVPLYLNSTRDKLVLAIVLHIEGGVEPSEFSRRGTAVCCWAGE